MKKEYKDSDYEEYEFVSEKEQELIDSYMDDEFDNYMKEKAKKEKKVQKENEKILKKELEDNNLEEYDIEDDFVESTGPTTTPQEVKPYYEEHMEPRKNKNIVKKIISGIIFVVILLAILAVIDIVCVTKLDKGPFFAIPLHTYDDGGTKEYYGLGYKVIKYNQVQGRRDRELGTWSLQYNVDPIYSEIVDLAIEFNNDEEGSYKKYNKKLLVVSGSLKEVDEENNKIVMTYEDEGGKYSLDIVCNMETDKENLSILEPKYEISAMGTMIDYKYKSNKNVATIYLDNCFAEQ